MEASLLMYIRTYVQASIHTYVRTYIVRMYCIVCTVYTVYTYVRMYIISIWVCHDRMFHSTDCSVIEEEVLASDGIVEEYIVFDNA